MAISHVDHDHPNTPAARAACRKQMANGDTPLTGNPIPRTVAGVVNNALRGTPVEPAVLVGKSKGGPRIEVVPRRRGDGGVVKGLKNSAPREVRIRTAGDFPADIPTGHTLTIARAWEKGWSVILGERLNDGETRILIGGNGVQVSLVWNAEGASGVFVRSAQSSITHRVDSGPQAIALAAGEEEWPWTNHGKAV